MEATPPITGWASLIRKAYMSPRLNRASTVTLFGFALQSVEVLLCRKCSASE